MKKFMYVNGVRVGKKIEPLKKDSKEELDRKEKEWLENRGEKCQKSPD